jgi:hypothetical protein
MQEAAEVLQQLDMKVGVSAIVPESEQLFAIATDIEKYSEKVRKRRRTNTTFSAHSRQQPAQLIPFPPTNSNSIIHNLNRRARQNSQPLWQMHKRLCLL